MRQFFFWSGVISWVVSLAVALWAVVVTVMDSRATAKRRAARARSLSGSDDAAALANARKRAMRVEANYPPLDDEHHVHVGI
jgi:hypothetical protein